MRLLAAIAMSSAALAGACAPGPDIDPARHTQYLIYDWNAAAQSYDLQVSTIETLEDPRRIAGTVAELRGGGALVVTGTDLTTAEGFERAMEIRRHKTPSAEYYLDGDVVVPFDTDTQLMVTLYHHLERAEQYFRDLDQEPVGRMPVYYFPQFSLFGLPLPLFTDNAAYAITLDAFLIPPTMFLVNGVPLSANRGVIVHEYSHAVFNLLVYGDSRAPEPLWNPDLVDVRDELRSLDEGLADLFGALATGDPDFIGVSVVEQAFQLDRDLGVERVWDAELQQKIDDSATAAGPNPYVLGSVIAAALWSTREFLDDGELARVTLAAMEEIALPDASFRLEHFFAAWLAELDPADVPAACAVLTARLTLLDIDVCG